jgi:hypothetical protein
MAFGSYSELLYASNTTGATLATFTTEVQANTAATMGMQPSLPPNYFRQDSAVNRAIKVVARGILATTGVATYTFTVRGGPVGPQITGPILAGTGALSSLSTATTSLWTFEVDIVFKTLGAGPSGTGNSTLTAVGELNCPGIAATANCAVYGGAASPGTLSTFDPRIENFINFNIACGTSNAANTITLQQLMIYGLN